MKTFSYIKSSISMQDVCIQYGFEVDRAGFSTCPFHQEKTNSFKIYQKRWVCFGCGTSGDVIDFIQKYFNLNFQKAIERIDYDFGLGLNSKPPSKSEINKYNLEKARKEELKKWAEHAWSVLSDYRYSLWIKNDSYMNEVLTIIDYHIDCLIVSPEQFRETNGKVVMLIEQGVYRGSDTGQSTG